MFKEMALTYGRKFTDLWQGQNAEELKLHWAKQMHDLTDEEMVRGVIKMRKQDWPPTLPEFLKLCRPDINPLNAYYEAVEGSRRRELGEVGTWTHPAIFWASVRVSAFELKNQTYSQIRQRWEAALSAELAKDQWEEIPAPMIALPAPGKEKVSKEVVTKLMENLKGVAKSANARIDHKRWARKILDREKAGDKTLTKIQIDFAKQALNSEE